MFDKGLALCLAVSSKYHVQKDSEHEVSIAVEVIKSGIRRPKYLNLVEPDEKAKIYRVA